MLLGMLYGRPPFESECVETTYERIKRCQYVFPEYCNVSAKSQHFISRYSSTTNYSN